MFCVCFDLNVILGVKRKIKVVVLWRNDQLWGIFYEKRLNFLTKVEKFLTIFFLIFLNYIFYFKNFFFIKKLFLKKKFIDKILFEIFKYCKTKLNFWKRPYYKKFNN